MRMNGNKINPENPIVSLKDVHKSFGDLDVLSVALDSDAHLNPDDLAGLEQLDRHGYINKM